MRNRTINAETHPGSWEPQAAGCQDAPPTACCWLVVGALRCRCISKSVWPSGQLFFLPHNIHDLWICYIEVPKTKHGVARPVIDYLGQTKVRCLICVLLFRVYKVEVTTRCCKELGQGWIKWTYSSRVLNGFCKVGSKIPDLSDTHVANAMDIEHEADPTVLRKME